MLSCFMVIAVDQVADMADVKVVARKQAHMCLEKEEYFTCGGTANTEIQMVMGVVTYHQCTLSKWSPRRLF
jgi:hypothetical protein